MKLLFIGDIVGKPGREIVRSVLPQLIKQYDIEVVIANGENAAHGKGITSKIYQEFLMSKINVVTLGNHAFSKKMILDSIESCNVLIRPYNMLPQHIGKSSVVINTSEGTLAIHNLCGQVFMHNVTESPISAFKTLLNKTPADMHFVDLHAEATAEKQTFFHFYKDQCVGIVGTHTHVTTADEDILDGCGYISDVGMCGVKQSILGRSIDEVMRQLAGEKTHYEVAKGPAMFNAVLLEIENQQCIHIQRINL